MIRDDSTRRLCQVLLAILIITAFSIPFAAGTTAAQQNNSSSENTTDTNSELEGNSTASSTDNTCDDQSLPEMDQARLYTPEPTVTSGQAGEIEGAFELDPQVDCPVVVDVSLTVPSGMTISGGTDWQEAEAGIVATEFTMNPEGSSLQGLSANVYSEDTGSRTVDAQIEYWPEGSPELAQTIDTTRLTFQVEEPNEGPDGVNQEVTQDDGGSNGGDLPELTPIRMLFVLALIAVGGIVYVFPKINIQN